jgi:enamine deaminase RidA (YjgF/YER057c/UK114 family)
VNSSVRVSSAEVRQRLRERNLELPVPWVLPPGVSIPANLVRVVGTTAWVSGHVPIGPDGQLIGTFGKVGAEVTLETAQRLAVAALLGALASVERAVGDLGRVKGWCRLHCMVNTTGGFSDYPAVFNPASQLLREVFGDEVGGHARVAVGVAGLPWNVPVEIEATVELVAE